MMMGGTASQDGELAQLKFGKTLPGLPPCFFFISIELQFTCKNASSLSYCWLQLTNGITFCFC